LLDVAGVIFRDFDLPPIAVPTDWQEVWLQDEMIPSVVGCFASAAFADNCCAA